MNACYTKVLAWSIVIIFLFLAAVGITLQALADSAFSGISLPILVIVLILSMLWPIIGALIVSRHPRHPVGWLLCLGVITGPIDMFTAGYALYDIHVFTGSFPWLTPALIWLNWGGAYPIATTAFTLMLLLFPDGRFPAKAWRAVALASVGALLFYLPLGALRPGPVDPNSNIFVENPIGANPTTWAYLETWMWLTLSLLMLSYGAALLSLVSRYRKASANERQQIKWLIIPAAAYGLALPLLSLIFQDGPELVETIILAVGIASLMGIVLAVAFTIFRHRLYDVDIIINRTLVYVLLSACTMGLYVLIVGFIGSLFQPESRSIIAFLTTGLVALLFQPLREYLQRGVNRFLYGQRDDPLGTLSQVGKRLEGAVAPEMLLDTLVTTISQTLRLPFVAISLGSDDGSRIAAMSGHEVADTITLPLIYQGELVGQLIAGARAPGEAFGKADMQLLANIAHQAGPVAYAQQLTEDLRRSRVKLITAREEERRRLRRDLHDGLGPVLASQGLKMSAVMQMLNEKQVRERQILEEIAKQMEITVAEIRRLVYELRPATLDDLGLVGALRDYASLQIIASHEPSRLQIDIETPADRLPALPAAIEVAAYRIATEALTNIVKHASATEASVIFNLEAGNHSCNLRLEIADNGIGLQENHRSGVGMISMRERAEEVGGSFHVESQAVGGVRIVATLPLVDIA